MTAKLPNLWITFDFELGWGVVENQRWIVREQNGVYERMTAQFAELLAGLESLEVPVCWATVGAMTQNQNQYDFHFLPDGIRLKLEQFCKTSKETTRDGRRFIDALMASNYQKIVSHSYSHVVYTAGAVTEDQVRADLAKVGDILLALGGDPSIMVLPENKIPDLGLLKSAGVSSFRLPPKHSSGRISCIFEKIYSHPSADKYTDDSTTFFPGSMLFKPRGDDVFSRRLFDLQISGLKQQLKRGVSQHIWLHPFNFGEYDFLYESFSEFVAWAANQREKRSLNIEAMGV